MKRFKSFGIDTITSKSNPGKDPKNVSLEWKNIVVKSPPMNSSDEVKIEMMVLKRETSSRTKEDDISIEAHDSNATKAIRDYLDNNKLLWNKTVVDELTDIGGKISRHFKNVFLRPRPSQLEKPLGVVINQLMDRDMDIKKTPSYPAGHSTQSRLVAEYYVKKYPDHKAGLIDAAQQSGLGRIKAGWHYPSDHKAGIQLAKDILPLLEL